MKLLTITIPCYNSQEYMSRSVDSALSGGDDVEIIIVDDGSTDDTYKIAKKYEEDYPDIIKVIHKDNGGHGSAVNTGIENATGLFFKVLDSDDWLDKKSLLDVLNFLRDVVSDTHPLDMLICNYVYEKPSEHKHKVIRYTTALPAGKFITWHDVRHFMLSQNLIMHSIIYKTKILKKSGLKLPEHTFYVDNIFAYAPLHHINNIYYMNTNLYRYYIGREDQSVNEEIMIKRIDQQIKVNTIMIDIYHDLPTVCIPQLRKYMAGYLAMVTITTSALLIISGTEENLKKRDDLWNYLKKSDRILYYNFKFSKLGLTLQASNKLNRKFVLWLYHVMNHIYCFN